MKETTTWRKFKLLIWKNMMIRRRSYINLLIELLIPILIFLTYALVVKYGKIFPQATIEKTQKPPKIDLKELNANFNLSTKLCYYPSVAFTKAIIKTVQSKLKLNAKNILDFHNETNFLKYFAETQGNHSIFAIAFQNLNGSSVPQDLVYLIRPYFKNVKWNTDTLLNNDIIQVHKRNLGSRTYIETGLLSLQIAIETSFVETLTKKSLPFNLVVQEFPYPQRINDLKTFIFYDVIFPYLITSCFTYTLFMTLANPTSDKNTGIKELMKTTGLSSWLIFLAWYCHYVIVNIISILLIVTILIIPVWSAERAIVQNSSFIVLFLVLFLYSSALITFGLMISSRFDNEVTSMLVGVLIWVGILLTFSMFTIETKKMKTFASIFPHMAVNYISKQIGIYEIKGTGAYWSNMYNSAQSDPNDLTITDGLWMLCTSIILFSLLSLYIEQLYPGQYGAPKPYYFILDNNGFWNKIMQSDKFEEEIDLISEDLGNVEPPTPNLRPGIRITHLSKSYGKLKVVNNVSMDFYEGLITVILGQNGAGKTTTISILTGMIKATSGIILIHGENIEYNMDLIRNSLGYCPQNNINFEELNVFDHFVFFGMLKGYNKGKATSQAYLVLDELNLHDQRKKRAAQLSGGMKRRLSLGIALMGDSKVLLLDEPTSGLDPETRRELWDNLIKLKKSRLVIITTQVMEEADALADRIAIIDHGQLACYGSPMFLKKIYGSGYHLTIIRDKNLFEKNNPGENQVAAITEVVRGKLNEAVLLNSNLNCLTYLLPYEKKSEYNAVLNDIENNKEVLCISHIEMSVTTLEEVFLKYIKNFVTLANAAGSFAGKNDKELKFNLQASALKDKKFKMFKLQLHALMRKRWLMFKRRYLMFCMPVLLGMILCIATFHLTYKTSFPRSKKELTFNITLSNYGRTTVYYSTNNKTGYFTKMKKKYDRLVEEQNSDAYEIDDVHQEILKKGEENFEFYRKKLIVAAEFIDAKQGKSANAMFSNPSLHGAIISVNLLCNAILQTQKDEYYSINSSISPLPNDQFHSKIDNLSNIKTTTIIVLWTWLMMFHFGVLLLVLPFMILPQMENSSNFKQLQLMCGVHPLFYWGIFYIVDFFFYFIWTLILISIMFVYQKATSLFLFDQPSDCCTLMFILVVYGLPVIPCTYLFSFVAKIFNAISRYSWSLFLPVVYVLIVFLKILPSWLNYFFALYPQYGLIYLSMEFCINALSKYAWVDLSAEDKVILCKNEPNPCCDNETSRECYQYVISKYGKTDEWIKYIMLASTFIYFAILLLLENKCLQKLCETIRLAIGIEKQQTERNIDNREDVKLQQERISQIMDRKLSGQRNNPTEDKQNVLLVHNLEKYFKHVNVVNQISFSVEEGECFGLLGVNGAGKTTTFRMLTGNLPVVKGECRIVSPSGQKFYLARTPTKYFSNIGYCPQNNSIEEILTGREVLNLFGKLRGIDKGLDTEIENLAKCLAFDNILNRACGAYSSGNKRKLNMAVALIGVPRVILLDEPTSGVDPISRRAMWNMIQSMQNQNIKPAIVLTTHSMEECEVLCNKVAIMKMGEFRCYGTIPQLKTKYAQGFVVTLKLTVDDDVAGQAQAVQDFKRTFKEVFKGACHLQEEETNLLQYHINDLSIRWSEIFQYMEEFQKEFSVIEDYTITETTLEQVFLKISRYD